MKIYLIPGLGYDSRIFERLNFKDYAITHINWIEPQKNEGIHEYSKRLFKVIPENEDDVILIGHSFGGVVAQEIAVEKKIDKIILISSIKSRNEIPNSLKLIKPLNLHRLFTKQLSVATVAYWGTKHGFVTEKDKNLFKSMVRNQSNTYLQWALKAISGWKTPTLPKRTTIFQIHGTDDKTFPIRLIANPNVLIENGCHIMVYNQHEKISAIINQELEADIN